MLKIAEDKEKSDANEKANYKINPYVTAGGGLIGLGLGALAYHLGTNKTKTSLLLHLLGGAGLGATAGALTTLDRDPTAAEKAKNKAAKAVLDLSLHDTWRKLNPGTAAATHTASAATGAGVGGLLWAKTGTGAWGWKDIAKNLKTDKKTGDILWKNPNIAVRGADLPAIVQKLGFKAANLERVAKAIARTRGKSKYVALPLHLLLGGVAGYTAGYGGTAFMKNKLHW